MPSYELKILSHTIIGYPYIPICKFVLINQQNPNSIKQSLFINPPLYDPNFKLKQSKISSIKRDVTQNKQFPLVFNIRNSQDAIYVVKVIQLNKNGRQKTIGFTKITFNKENLGKMIKHKIIGESPIVLQKNKKQKKKQILQPISILQVLITFLKTDEQLDEQSHQNIQNDEQNDSRAIVQQQQTSIQKHKSKIVNASSSQDSQNERHQYVQTARQQPQPEKTNKIQRFKPQNVISQSYPLQSYYQMKNNKQKQQKAGKNKIRRTIVFNNQEQQHKNNLPIKRNIDSRVSIGRIYYQKRNNQQSNQIYINNQHNKSHQQNQYPQNKSRLKNKYRQQKRNTDSNNSMGKIHDQKTKQNYQNQNRLNWSIQYFISNLQTQKNGCNCIKNLAIITNIYQEEYKQPKPKFITFLTYELYEKIARISNESQKKDEQPSFMHRRKLKKSNNKTTTIKNLSDTEFGDLSVYIPKFCLILRIEIIFQDQSVFRGSINNQIQYNRKSLLINKDNTAQKKSITISFDIQNSSLSLQNSRIQPNSQIQHKSEFQPTLKSNKNDLSIETQGHINLSKKRNLIIETESQIAQLRKYINTSVKQIYTIENQKKFRKQKSLTQNFKTVNYQDQYQDQDLLKNIQDTRIESNHNHNHLPYKLCFGSQIKQEPRKVITQQKNQYDQKIASKINQLVRHFETINQAKLLSFKKQSVDFKKLSNKTQQKNNQTQISENGSESRFKFEQSYQRHKNLQKQLQLQDTLPKVILNKPYRNLYSIYNPTTNSYSNKINLHRFLMQNNSSKSIKFDKSAVRSQFFKKLQKYKNLKLQKRHQFIEDFRNNNISFDYGEKSPNKKLRKLLTLQNQDISVKNTIGVSSIKQRIKNNKRYIVQHSNPFIHYQNKDLANLVQIQHQNRKKNNSEMVISHHKKSFQYVLKIIKIQLLNICNLSKTSKKQKNHKRNDIYEQNDFLQYSRLKDHSYSHPKMYLKIYIDGKKQRQYITQTKLLIKISQIQKSKSNQKLNYQSLQNSPLKSRLNKSILSPNKQLLPNKQIISSNKQIISTNKSIYTPNKSISTNKSIFSTNNAINGYLETVWDFTQNNPSISIKPIKRDDFLILESHVYQPEFKTQQFVGKCIIPVSELIAMRQHNKITAYLVHAKKITSHLLLSFIIDQFL